MSSSPSKNRPLNPRRIGVIAMHTFTQLVRMKVFYFLGIFAVVLLCSNLLNIQDMGRPDLKGADVLRSIRSISLGVMTLFSVVLGIVATALLLPKDVEDRTLYTILAKPVPRLDYLIGKLGGVLMLIFVSLLVMDLLMTGVLAIRTNLLVSEQLNGLAAHWPADEREALRQDILKQGPTWGLHGATLAVFLRSAVIASTALLLSTFSTSTLFTTVTAVLVYFIGNFQADAREVFLGGEGASRLERFGGMLLSVIFPDFKLYNVVDSVVQGIALPPAVLGTLIGLTTFYVVLHLFVSWLVFAGKEF